MMRSKLTAIGLLVAGLSTMVHASPQTLSYQGSVLQTDGNPIPDGPYDMRFSIYTDKTTGTMNWTETDSPVPVSNGLFSTCLGDGTPMPVAMFASSHELWLEVAIDFDRSGTFEPDEVYSPRQRMTAAVWAMDADRLMGMQPGDFAMATHTHAGSDIISAVSTATLALTAPWSGLTGVPEATGDVTGTYPFLTVQGLQGQTVSDIVPTSGQLLRWNGTAWLPTTLSVLPVPNQPPVAILQVDPSIVVAGESTILSLALSYDPEGGALTYAFDPKGRCVGAPASYGPASTTTVAYTDAGNYLAAGWARDSAGAFARAQALVAVREARSTSTIVDAMGNTGWMTSLAVVTTCPAISYYNNTTDDLIYVRASIPDGSSWGTPITLDSDGDVGRYGSLDVVDGHPAIAYYDVSNRAVKYIRASDVHGSSWGSGLTLDSAGMDGTYASLAVISNRPAVAYRGQGNSRLRYIRANDASGTSWGTAVTVTSSAAMGGYVSLAATAGHPAIAYYEQSNGDLCYVRALEDSGTSWGTPVIVDSDSNVGWYASLVVVAGQPAIAYHDWTKKDLKYVRAADSNGTSWTIPIVVDDGADVGRYCSLSIVQGRPAIAYYDGGALDLKYVQAIDTTGAVWGTPITVDSTGDVGAYASLAEVNGQPGISYIDWTNGDLRYATFRPN